MKNKALKLIFPILLVFSLSSCLRGSNDAISSSDENYSSVNASSKPTPSSKGADENCKHKWLLDTNQSYEATCTHPGTVVKVCQYCGLETSTKIEPLGHDYQDSPYMSGYWEATCTEEGRRVVRCTRCSDEQVEIIPAGHQYEWTDGDIGEEGHAGICNFGCIRCGESNRLGFYANMLTLQSRFYAVENADGGVRFWGRPRGNGVELNEDGDLIDPYAEQIFDPNVGGNYLEYEFYLTPEQAVLLNNCKIACDAVPNKKLYEKKLDFFKLDPYSSDDLCGYYVEGDNIGERIKDFRYALYVNGELQTMDYSIDNPVFSSSLHGQYVIPFTFNFHEGWNTIRLENTGGYKSTFYKFTFITEEIRPDDGHEHTWVAGEKENGRTVERCRCGLIAYNFEIADATGWNNPDKKMNGKYPPDNKSAWSNPCIPEGKYEFQINAKLTSPSHVDRYFYNQWETDTATTADKETEDPYRYFISVNDGEKVYTPRRDKNYGEVGLIYDEYNYVVMNVEEYVAGNLYSLELNHGYIGYSIYISNVRLVCLEEAACEHVWGGQTNCEFDGCSISTLEECRNCGRSKVTINAQNIVEGSIKANGKLNKSDAGRYDGTAKAVYKFYSPKTCKGNLSALVYVDYDQLFLPSNGYSHYTGKVNGAVQKVLEDGSTNTILDINGENIPMPTTTYFEMGITGTDVEHAGIANYGDFNVQKGINTITFAATNSYGLCYCEFYIIF